MRPPLVGIIDLYRGDIWASYYDGLETDSEVERDLSLCVSLERLFLSL